MGINVIFTPSPLNFGVVATSSTTGNEVMSERLTAAANVTASISNNASGYFKLSALRSFTETKTVYTPPTGTPTGVPSAPVQIDPTGKPIAGISYNQTGVWNGKTPLNVPAGQYVSVDVQFVAPASSTAPSSTATLNIIGDTWNPIAITLNAEVASLSLEIGTPSILQAHSITVPFKIVSRAGPTTPVTLSLGKESSIPGFLTIDSIATPSLNVSQGSPASGSLQLSAALNCSPGNCPLSIYATAFGGTAITFTFTVNVIKLVLSPKSPIAKKYLSLQGPAGILGPPVSPESFCSDYTGQYATYKNGAIYWDGVSAAAFELDNVHGPIYSLFLGPDNEPATAPQTRFGYPTTDVVPVQAAGKAGFKSRCVYQGLATTLYASGTTGAQYVPDGPINTKWLASTLGFPITVQANAPPPSQGPSYVLQAFEEGIVYAPIINNAAPTAILPNLTFAPSTPTNAFHAQTLLNGLSAVINNAVNKFNSTKPPPGNTIGMQDGPFFPNAAAPVSDYIPGPLADFGSTLQNRRFQVAQKMFAQAFVDSDFTVSFDVELRFGGPVGLVDAQGNPISDLTGKPITVPASSSVIVLLSNIQCVVTKAGLASASDQQSIISQATAAFQAHAEQLIAITSAETGGVLDAIALTTRLNGDFAVFVNSPVPY